MNPRLKVILTIAAKNAVNALLTNMSASQVWPQLFNLHSHAGVIAVAKLAGMVVGVRECMIWVPLILKWSATNANPSE